MTAIGKTGVEDKIFVSGGFADVRRGRYMGQPVAVKTLRTAERGDLEKMRKVNVDDIVPANRFMAEPFCSSNFAKKLCSGARYPIRTSWSLPAFRRT